jgi:4-amino-4-deoxy-L-arabinose transferase-like glycosyltransferase
MKAGFTALLLLLLALVIRIAIAVQGIHGTDVLAHVNGTRSLLLTGSPYCRAYYNYPPLYSVIQLPTILMFGWNSLGYKFMPVLFDTLLSIALYMAVKRVAGSEKLALAVQLLWVFNPLAIVASAWYGLFDSIPTLFALTSLLALMDGRSTISAILVALGIVTKVFPALYLIPQALYPGIKRLKDFARYVVIAVVVSLALWLALSAKCFSNALEYQLGFHLQRIDKGLSLAPYAPYSAILSLAIPTTILTIVALRLRKGFLNNKQYLIVTALCTVLLVALNPFIYPHYLIWFLPLSIIALVQGYREKGVVIAVAITLVLSAISLTYWKFYKVEAIVSVLRITLYTTLVMMLLILIASVIELKNKY